MSLLDRHIAFVEALRDAGLPVSLAEGLDSVAAIGALGLGERETLRAAYASTLVKRQNHRPGFDQVFDLYWPALVGDGVDRVGYSETFDRPDRVESAAERLGLPRAAREKKRAVQFGARSARMTADNTKGHHVVS